MIDLAKMATIFRTNSGLIRIFRFFSGGGALVFFFLLIGPIAPQEIDPSTKRTMFLFAATYGLIFIYLMIPKLEIWLKKYHLPPVLIAASVIPIAIINAKYRALLAIGSPINTLEDTMTLTILLIFPLIATAWRYSFPIVLLFFVVLGFLDPLLIILINESITPELFNAVNASLVRILALGAVGFMITELRNQQRVERKALQEANRKLEEYALDSERLAASRERNRIARELHDTLAHTLSGLSIQLEAAVTIVDKDNEQLGILLDRARKTIRVGLSETRRSLEALRASPLEDFGLLLALQRLIENDRERTDIPMKFSLPADKLDWSMQLEETTYRIAQEALENTIRHSNATEVKLEMKGDSENLYMDIEDNGRGFDAEYPENESRFGLKGMRERALAIGGRLVVDSQPGRGCVIRFTWKAQNESRN